MKNIHPIKIASIAILTSAFIRLLQKLFAISPKTGFYTQFDFSGYLLLIIMVVGCVISCLALRDKSEDTIKVINCPILASLSIITGLSIAAETIGWLLHPSTAVPLVPIPGWMNIILIITGILSAISMLYIAYRYYKGLPFGKNGVVAAILPLWQAIHTITRFGYFKQVTTVSDNFIETMFMALCCMFLMNQAYILSGLTTPRKSRNAMGLGLAMAITGIPLVTGQIAGILVMGNDITGPGFASCFYILSISLYALVFISHLLKDTSSEITSQVAEETNN